MANFAVLCPEFTGHLLPTLTIGQELQRRGHQVTLVSGGDAAPVAVEFDIPFHALPDPDIRALPPVQPLHVGAAMVGMLGNMGQRAGLCYQAERWLRLGPEIVQSLAVDGVIVEQYIVSGGTISEHLGLPYATVSTAIDWREEPQLPPFFTPWAYMEGTGGRIRNWAGYLAWHWFMRPVLHRINRWRVRWGLDPLRRPDDSLSRRTHIAQGCPEFDFPRQGLPTTFHYGGSLGGGRPIQEIGFPWERMDGRPLVFASLGTTGDGRNLRVLRMIAEACAELPVQLVLTRGKWTERQESVDDLNDLPGTPLVVDYAPQLRLLDRTALMITHGGINSVLEALSRGVPMVALPRGVDQPGTAARVARAGAGLQISFSKETPRQLRGAIERVLCDPSFRRQAQEMQQALARTGGAEHAAEVIERALLAGEQGCPAGSPRGPLPDSPD